MSNSLTLQNNSQLAALNVSIGHFDVWFGVTRLLLYGFHCLVMLIQRSKNKLWFSGAVESQV